MVGILQTIDMKLDQWIVGFEDLTQTLPPPGTAQTPVGRECHGYTLFHEVITDFQALPRGRRISQATTKVNLLNLTAKLRRKRFTNIVQSKFDILYFGFVIFDEALDYLYYKHQVNDELVLIFFLL